MKGVKGGAMAAVIGLTPDEVLRVIEKYELKDIDVANYITPLQSVVAGRKEAIDSAGKYFEQAGAKAYLLLNVSGAFHSMYMKQASVKFENYVHKHSFKKMTIPVISNINGGRATVTYCKIDKRCLKIPAFRS